MAADSSDSATDLNPPASSPCSRARPMSSSIGSSSPSTDGQRLLPDRDPVPLDPLAVVGVLGLQPLQVRRPLGQPASAAAASSSSSGPLTGRSGGTAGPAGPLAGRSRWPAGSAGRPVGHRRPAAPAQRRAHCPASTPNACRAGPGPAAAAACRTGQDPGPLRSPGRCAAGRGSPGRWLSSSGDFIRRRHPRAHPASRRRRSPPRRHHRRPRPPPRPPPGSPRLRALRWPAAPGRRWPCPSSG